MRQWIKEDEKDAEKFWKKEKNRGFYADTLDATTLSIRLSGSTFNYFVQDADGLTSFNGTTYSSLDPRKSPSQR